MARRQQKDLVFLIFRSECAASMREAFGAAAQEKEREAHQDRVERAVRHFEQVRPAHACACSPSSRPVLFPHTLSSCLILPLARVPPKLSPGAGLSSLCLPPLSAASSPCYPLVTLTCR